MGRTGPLVLIAAVDDSIAQTRQRDEVDVLQGDLQRIGSPTSWIVRLRETSVRGRGFEEFPGARI